MTYRYHTGQGLRQKLCPIGAFEGKELKSEDFDTDEEFCLAIASDVLELIRDDAERMESEDE